MEFCIPLGQKPRWKEMCKERTPGHRIFATRIHDNDVEEYPILSQRARRDWQREHRWWRTWGRLQVLDAPICAGLEARTTAGSVSNAHRFASRTQPVYRSLRQLE
jgi:hypothetical protein